MKNFTMVKTWDIAWHISTSKEDRTATAFECTKVDQRSVTGWQGHNLVTVDTLTKEKMRFGMIHVFFRIYFFKSIMKIKTDTYIKIKYFLTCVLIQKSRKMMIRTEKKIASLSLHVFLYESSVKMMIHTLYKNMVSLPCVFPHESLKWNSVKMLIHSLYKNMVSLLCVFTQVSLNLKSMKLIINTIHKDIFFFLCVLACVFLMYFSVKILTHNLCKKMVSLLGAFARKWFRSWVPLLVCF